MDIAFASAKRASEENFWDRRYENVQNHLFVYHSTESYCISLKNEKIEQAFFCMKHKYRLIDSEMFLLIPRFLLIKPVASQNSRWLS